MTPGELAQVFLECLRTAVHASPYDIPDEKICLRFGSEVNPTLGTAENECCTGLAWVRVVSIQPLADPADPALGNCVPTARRLTLELGTARCIPFGTVGAGPTCAQWTEAALKMDSDQQVMESALCCAQAVVEDLNGGIQVVPGLYEPFGPDGDCISGTTLVTLDYDCGCSLNGA